MADTLTSVGRSAGGAAIGERSGLDWGSVLWFAGGAAMGAGPLSDNSFLTHVANGRVILDSGVPHADPYSFTAHGAPWVVQSWLYSVVVAGADRWVGPWLIRILVGAIVGSLGVALWRLSAPATSLLGRLGVTVAAVATGLGYWNERPQTLAFALLAVALLLLRSGPQRVWLVAPLFALWVNVHGSWPLGLIAIGCVLTRQLLLDRRLTRSLIDPGLIAVGGCVVGAGLSPYRFELLTFPTHLLGRSEVLRYIVEWRPLSVADPVAWAVLAAGVTAAAAIVSRRDWGWLPTLVIFGALVAQSRRNVPVGMIMWVPIVAPSARFGEWSVPHLRRRAAAPIVALLLIPAAARVAIADEYDLSPYPVAAVDWLAARSLIAQPDARVVAPDYVGNYLEWRFGPRSRVYVDDRAEVFDRRVIQGFVEGLLMRRIPWERVLRDVQATVLVWPSDSPLGRSVQASDQWKVAWQDPDWLIACPTNSGC